MKLLICFAFLTILVAKHNAEAQAPTLEREEAILSAIADKLNTKAGPAIKFHVATELNNADVGSVVHVQPYKEVPSYELLRPYLKIINIVDKSNATVEYHRKNLGESPTDDNRPFWLTGADLKGHVDNDSIFIDGYYAVTGTKQFPNANRGTTTVLLLKQYDTTAITAEIDKAIADREAKQKKAANELAARQREASFRKWASADGKYTVEARAASYANGVVLLEKRDGKTSKVPLDKLSDADKVYMNKWREDKQTIKK
jgi:hypothetical protein